MLELPSEVVGDAYTSSYYWEVLEDLVDVGNRMAGQAGEREETHDMIDDGYVQELKVGGRWPYDG